MEFGLQIAPRVMISQKVEAGPDARPRGKC